MNPQYWLAEIDQHGNPKLIDGAHDDAEGANQAAYLIRAMNLGKPGRKFAVAKVELSECVPSAKGVNHDAVRTINRAKADSVWRDAMAAYPNFEFSWDEGA